MTDRPLIFSAPMVRALLEGRKTQTRRVLRTQPAIGGQAVLYPTSNVDWQLRAKDGSVLFSDRLPFLCGDRIWVRETWKPHSIHADKKPREMPASKVFYAADGVYAPSNTRWITPIHMLRWASRLTLIVTDVRVQRLQAISNADARAEGCGVNFDHPDPDATWEPFPIERFRDLWNKLHGPALHAWDANPWVAALTFTVHKCNIDEMQR